MPGRKIVVQLIGDSASLERAFDKSERKGKSFGNAMGVSGASLKTFAKAGAAGAAVGGLALVAKGLTSSVAAAKEAEVAQGKLRQALKSSGNSYGKFGEQIDASIQKTSKLAAMDDEELSDVFSNLVRSTGSVAKATKGMALAAEIARARNIPLATAAKAVEKAYKGSEGALKRVGVVVPKVSRAYDTLKAQESALRDQMKGATDAEKKSIETKIEMIKQSYDAARASDKQATAQSAIAEAQKQFAGSAAAYGRTATGAQEKLAVAWENLQEKLGAKLLPILTKATLKLVEFVEWGEKNWPKFSKAVSEVWAKVRPVFEAFRSYFDGWVKIIQGIIEGDWALVWAGVKKAVVSGINLVYEYLKAVPLELFKLGLRMGKALGSGILQGLKGLGEKIANKLIPFGDPVGADKQFKGLRKRIAKANQRQQTPAGTSTYAGPRAHGGPVSAGKSYLVGEHGMELFTPGRSGNISPNAAGGGISIGVVHVHGVQNVRELVAEIQRLAKNGSSQTRGRFGGQNLALG